MIFNLKRPLAILKIALISVALIFSISVQAGEQKKGQIEIETSWARPLPATAVNGAAYLSLKNTGDSEISIVSAEASISDRVQIHTHVHENGLMKMKHLHSLNVMPNEVVVFQPGKMHFMLMGLQKQLVEGDEFDLELMLEGGEKVHVMVTVKEP